MISEVLSIKNTIAIYTCEISMTIVWSVKVEFKTLKYLLTCLLSSLCEKISQGNEWILDLSKGPLLMSSWCCARQKQRFNLL